MLSEASIKTGPRPYSVSDFKSTLIGTPHSSYPREEGKHVLMTISQSGK